MPLSSIPLRLLAAPLAAVLLLGTAQAASAATPTAAAHATPASSKKFTKTPTPTVTGADLVGSVVTAHTGTWKPKPTHFGYVWTRDGKAISGATASSYRLAVKDAGQRIAVKVTATKKHYRTTTHTSATLTVSRSLTATPTPRISGSGEVGEQLSVNTGTWQPAPVALSVQWKRDGSSIGGATGRTYTLTDSDAGTDITATVHGSRDGFVAASRTSAPLSVQDVLTSTPAPTIVGSNLLGQTVTANTAGWAPQPVSFSYAWYRNGSLISGATGGSYTLSSADSGTSLSVTVTGRHGDSPSVSRTSGSFPVQAILTSTPTPSIGGTPRVGQTLTATAGDWEPSPVMLSYQWNRNGAPIAGATSSLYTASSADFGTILTVTVVGAKPGFPSVAETSYGESIAAPIAISGDGDHAVGSDVQAGTYVTSTATSGCYWERDSSFDGSDGSVIANDFGSGQRIVTILSSDVDFHTSGCGDWIPVAYAPAVFSITDGQYLVGTQMPAGRYRTTVPASSYGCYWATLSDFTGDDNIVANDDVSSGQVIVDVPSTVAGFESSGCGTWTRIG